MASLSLDSLPHPQSYPSAVGPAERRPIAQNRDAPTVSNTHSDSVAVAPNVSPNARLQNHDLIECIDLTASELAAWLASLGEPPISFVDTQMHTKDDGHKRNKDRTATGAIGIQDPSKRTADDAGLNEGGKGVPGLGKVRRKDPTDDIDNTDHDNFLALIRSPPKPVFCYPLSWRDFQGRENTTSSSRPNGPGDSQDDSLVIDDEGGKTVESGASTRATSVVPKIRTAHLLSSLRREELETLEGLDTATIPAPPVEPLS
ncbi:hypothetical protein ABVK25_010257 [Lepraria finkii]|uniref:Uncharacterized protein n=1 Tax=Lepraria finkii TaxID=1340010 RepID=A0ABR4AUV9_9LECA